MFKFPDTEIWKLVLQLIVSTSQITPPSSKPSYGGTPRKYNSASHLGSQQTKKYLEEALRDELWDCSFSNVQGFFEKYFDSKSWTQKGKNIFSAIKHMHVDGHWTFFPDPPTESNVWQWWTTFQNSHLTDSPGLYYRTKHKGYMTGLDVEAQLDLFIKSRNKSPSDLHNWADIRVIGEHTVSQDGCKFLQLARYARHVFSTQPRRWFLHGFTLCGTIMELHIFDRSGAYSAEPFDIHQDPERFIRAISGYCMMNDKELGIDTFVQRDKTNDFVIVNDYETKEETRVYIEMDPIALERAIVCRGTSCFRTTDHKNIVKFSWVPASRLLTEPNLLMIARKKNVKGVARLISHKRIISTHDWRNGLNFSMSKSSKRSLQSRTKSSSVLDSWFTITPLSEKKSKSPEKEDASLAKKPRSNCQVSSLSQVYEANDSSNNWQALQRTQPLGEPYVQRVFSCLVVSPVGRPLFQYKNVKELLCCFRDAVKAHQSLFIDGKILHRDISLNNIIITDPKADGFSGMLIDLDLATSIDVNGKNERSGAQKMTGTLKYMAIEVVEFAFRDARRDLEHTYRHDLESFFYVFLDICINYGWPDGSKSRVDALKNWYIGDYESIAYIKRGQMGKERFESQFLTKFSPTFDTLKNLACILRNALFGEKDVYTKTPEDFLSLYESMIKAFDKAQSTLD